MNVGVPAGTQDYRVRFENRRLTTADFIGDLQAMQAEVLTETGKFAHMAAPSEPPVVDMAAIEALLAWSLDPDNFAPDDAERLRAEAWGRDFAE